MSAFAFGGTPARVVEDVVARHALFLSEALLREYRAVPSELLDRQKVTPAQWRALVAGMAAVVAIGRVVVPKRRVRLCRDSDDDMLLDVCLAGGADLLVTGDADLLSIDPKQLLGVGLTSLRIVSPRQFVSGVQGRA